MILYCWATALAEIGQGLTAVDGVRREEDMVSEGLAFTPLCMGLYIIPSKKESRYFLFMSVTELDAKA